VGHDQMEETCVSASQTVSLLAAIGNGCNTTVPETKDGECSSSGASASSLSWVLLGGRRVGLVLPIYFCSGAWGGEEKEETGALGNGPGL
jgi:hypothetical protein